MASIDQNDSSLLEAVTALNVACQAAMPPSCTGKTSVVSSGLDSGYASQISTPDILRQTFTRHATVQRKNLWPSAFRKSKQATQLRPFNKPIPPATHERFSDLRELYAESLNKLARTQPNCQGILMSLKVLGESEATAEPWVFVQCDKAIFKQVNNFFKQPFVKVEFEPPIPTDHSPRLRVLVHPLQPRQLTKYKSSSDNAFFSNDELTRANDELIRVYGEQYRISLGTLCGVRVMNNTYKERSATIGGMVMVTGRTGERKLFAMTAGHFLWHESRQQDPELTFEIEDPNGSLCLDEDDFELDLNSITAGMEGEDELTSPAQQEREHDDSVAYREWLQIGEHTVSSHTLYNNGRNLDWALVAIDNEDASLPNIIKSQGRVIEEYAKYESGDGPSHEINVTLISARGPLEGTLSQSWSYMMLPLGSVLVRTYLLTLSNNKCLSSGDSGAWVIDEKTNKVYGHVVASDIFGRGYVVPICDVFADIKERLVADLVSLPSKSDILSFNLRHYMTQKSGSNPDNPTNQIGSFDIQGTGSPPSVKLMESQTHNPNLWGEPVSSNPYPTLLHQYNTYLAQHSFIHRPIGTSPSSKYMDSGYSTMNSSPNPSPHVLPPAFIADRILRSRVMSNPRRDQNLATSPKSGSPSSDI